MFYTRIVHFQHQWIILYQKESFFYINRFRLNELPKSAGKKIKITCSETSYYSDSYLYKNRTIKKTKNTYKDGMLLERMLKIGELNYISEKE